MNIQTLSEHLVRRYNLSDLHISDFLLFTEQALTTDVKTGSSDKHDRNLNVAAGQEEADHFQILRVESC